MSAIEHEAAIDPRAAAAFTGIGRLVVPVSDHEAALDFYRDVLGFAVLHDESADGYRYLHLNVPGQESVGLWLMHAGDADAGRRPGASADRPLLVLYTDDLDRAGARLHAHDVRVWGRREDSGSRSLHFADPDGNVIVVAQVFPPTRAEDPAGAGADQPGPDA